MSTDNREIKTVMHELKRRTLTVKKTELVTPHLKRVTLVGDHLADFVSLSPDDHVKIFFDVPGGEPAMRDYTPHRYDPTAQELDIEFYLHGDGPGSTWGANAKTGDSLVVGGPRGSKIVPYAFDWYLMIGDEASLPSFSRRLSELPPEAKALVFIEVEDEASRPSLKTTTSTEVVWLYRRGKPPGETSQFKEALGSAKFPAGDYFAWLSLEKSCAFELQDVLLKTKNLRKEWSKTTGYWIKENTKGLES